MFRVLVIALALWLGGCAIVQQEFNNRGGYVDYLADKYWWKADSKKMRALRAYALHTAIARIAMISPKGATQRNQLAYQIGNAGMYAKQLVACAYDAADEPCFYFDSIMVDYVAALYDAAIAALPLDDAKKLINDITGGIAGPAAAADALQALIHLGVDAVRYGTVSAALYRDTLELEVQVWINSPSESGSLVKTQDVATLAAIYHAGNDNIPAWKAEIERLLGAGLEPTPNRRYLTRLFKLMTYACTQITPDPVFQQKCIVNPGTTSSARESSLPPSTPPGTKTGSGGTTTTTTTTTTPSPNQKLSSLVTKYTDIRTQIANNERIIASIQKKKDEGGSPSSALDEQISIFQQKNSDLEKQAKDLQDQIKAMQKKP